MIPQSLRNVFKMTELSSVAQPLAAINSDYFSIDIGRDITHQIRSQIGKFLVLAYALEWNALSGIKLLCEIAGKQTRPRAFCCTDDSVAWRKGNGSHGRESLPYSQVTQNVM